VASRAERLSRREIALAIPFLPFLGRSGPRQAAAYSTAILLRHAEKDAGSDPKEKDPGLSQAGRERALALRRLLARAGATHLFASEYRRTRETLVPLAEEGPLEIAVTPAADVKGLVDRIRALPAGSVAVAAGHSNTVPAIVIALGGSMKDLLSTPGGPALRDDEYARLFVLTWPAEGPAIAAEDEPLRKPAASSIELSYGA